MQLRCRVPRQPAGWEGICHIEGGFGAGWRECRVIDVSMLGLGLTLNHPSPSQLVGCHISVNVPAVGDSVGVRLESKVTNAEPTGEGVVRVGIEFDRPSESELAVAAVLSAMSNRSGSGLSRTRGR